MEEPVIELSDTDSILFCLFCEKNERQNNGICKVCYKEWYKKKFDDFVFRKIGSCLCCKQYMHKSVDLHHVDVTKEESSSTEMTRNTSIHNCLSRTEENTTWCELNRICESCKENKFSGNEFGYRNQIDSHRMSHTYQIASTSRDIGSDLPAFCCKLCKKQFKTNRGLARHEVFHNRDAKPHKCLFCSKVFNESKLMNEHYNTHKIKNMFKCKYCDKNFKFISHFVQHLAVHENLRKFKCKYCDKYFKQKCHLKTHESRHENLRNFKCKYCDKGFNEKTTLNKHESSHENLRNFKCKYCGKGFNEKTTLNKHESSHANLRKFKCKYCDKGFNQKCNLIEHESSHENVRKFKCIYCGKGFNRKSFLNDHERSHENLRIFKCKYCDKGFNRKSVLNGHERSHENVRKLKC